MASPDEATQSKGDRGHEPAISLFLGSPLPAAFLAEQGMSTDPGAIRAGTERAIAAYRRIAPSDRY